eukprot:TCALIF_03300-PA protein Name:"Similar to Tle4 Transducin-like enhancer protein 4 (Mus musculus)" AED:0.39 eAED:0.39 QI:0/0.5/0.44/0.77/0.37/0.55/9/0/362
MVSEFSIDSRQETRPGGPWAAQLRHTQQHLLNVTIEKLFGKMLNPAAAVAAAAAARHSVPPGPGPGGPGQPGFKLNIVESIERIKEEFNFLQAQYHNLKLDCEKLVQEKTEMQRHYVMYYEMSYGLNVEMHKQHQQQVVTAVERAKQVSMSELNTIIGQHQRPDLSRLMQLQAAGAGLPTSIAGLPPGLLGGASSVAAAAAAAAAASGQHGLMPPGLPVSSGASLVSSGHYPPTSSAAAAAAAAAALREQRREEEHNLKAHSMAVAEERHVSPNSLYLNSFLTFISVLVGLNCILLVFSRVHDTISIDLFPGSKQFVETLDYPSSTNKLPTFSKQTLNSIAILEEDEPLHLKCMSRTATATT